MKSSVILVTREIYGISAACWRTRNGIPSRVQVSTTAMHPSFCIYNR